MSEFVLREQLSSLHTADVRGLAALHLAQPTAASHEDGMEVDGDVDGASGSGSGSGKSLFLATSSRDMTAAISVLDQENGSFRKIITLAGHKDFVVPVCLFSSRVNPGYFESSSNAQKEKIVAVTGSRDCTVKVFDTDTGEATDTFSGHEYQVTAIAITNDGDIVSASLDKTMRLWRNGQCISVIKGHTGPILSLCALNSGDIVSGSGDSTIKKWIISKTGCVCESTWVGHTDTVRCLAMMSNVGVVSGSHDMTIRVWGTDGQKIAELVGHTGIIYAVSAMEGSGIIASGSEDNTTRIWMFATRICLQVIDHPGCVWAICCLPNGDVASGCSDSKVRIFTTRAHLKAKDDVIADFVSANERYRTSSNGPSQGVTNSNGLPENVKLEDPSCLEKPGNKDGAIKLVNEGGTGVAYSWNMGTMVWDRIGEITDGPGDVSQGGKMYNGKQYDYVFDVDIGDGIPHRKLPFNRGDNPVDVAQKWLEDQNLPETYKEQVVDFLVQNTGDSKTQMKVDPYQNVDPFTGGAAYQPSGLSSNGSAKLMHIPKIGMIYYETLPFDNLFKKILEFYSDINKKNMPHEDKACLETAIGILKTNASSSGIGAQAQDLLSKCLEWPSDKVFPCIDLIRIVILQEADCLYFADAGLHVLEKILSISCTPDAPIPTKLVTLKLLCNCFRHKSLVIWVSSKAEKILNAFSTLPSETSNKHVRLALANFLLNLSVLFSESDKVEIPILFQSCSLACEIIRHGGEDDTEPSFRSLVCVGTLLYKYSNIKDMVKTLGMTDDFSSLSKRTGKVGEAASDLMSIL